MTSCIIIAINPNLRPEYIGGFCLIALCKLSQNFECWNFEHHWIYNIVKYSLDHQHADDCQILSFLLHCFSRNSFLAKIGNSGFWEATCQCDELYDFARWWFHVSSLRKGKKSFNKRHTKRCCGFCSKKFNTNLAKVLMETAVFKLLYE